MVYIPLLPFLTSNHRIVKLIPNNQHTKARSHTVVSDKVGAFGFVGEKLGKVKGKGKKRKGKEKKEEEEKRLAAIEEEDEEDEE